MLRRSSLGWPITLGVVMIVLLVVLTVGWIIVNVFAALRAATPAVHWAVLAVGTTFLLLVLAGVVMYLLISIKEIRLNQRQSNFIDAVTHELKSPIASLKLYLQTLDRRQLTHEQQADFHRFMLEDLQRLDNLIDNLLETARLDQPPPESELEDVEVSQVLRDCVETARLHYQLPSDAIELDLQPATVKARPTDVEMVFRNLVDNAIKYAGTQPKVMISSHGNGSGLVVTRIADNGPGIPAKLRRKIFGRFVRLGDELERAQPGTGLGLFLVRTLVKRMRGKITVHDRSPEPGTVFEVEMPAAKQ